MSTYTHTQIYTHTQYYIIYGVDISFILFYFCFLIRFSGIIFFFNSYYACVLFITLNNTYVYNKTIYSINKPDKFVHNLFTFFKLYVSFGFMIYFASTAIYIYKYIYIYIYSYNYIYTDVSFSLKCRFIFYFFIYLYLYLLLLSMFGTYIIYIYIYIDYIILFRKKNLPIFYYY